jgi:hypothetical protein
MPGCIPRGAPACGIRGKQKPGTPPGRPASRGATKGARANEPRRTRLAGKKEEGDAGDDAAAGPRPEHAGPRSAADVVVRTGTDDEPSLGVTRDRNGLTLQGAQRGGHSQDDEALPV